MRKIIVLLQQCHFKFQRLINNSLLMNQYPKTRQIENKPHRSNLPQKDYEDEQDLYQPRYTDNLETKELKNKMKMLVGKLANSKKEKETLAKQNEALQNQILNLQNNLRHMVAGFNNTTSEFPMNNELASKIAEFYKYDCLDKFFDLLGPEELTLKGIIYFYLQTFQIASNLVDRHFEPATNIIKDVGCLDTLEGPVMNVLRKAFQTNHQSIIALIAQEEVLAKHAEGIIDALNISCIDKDEAAEQIVSFLNKLIEILLECKISDPPLFVDVSGIGKRVEYNSLYHDPFDGFIKNKEDCFVILPEVRKKDNGEHVTKSLVLHKNYDLSN